MLRTWRFVTFGMMCLACIGCAAKAKQAYEGPERQSHEIAKLSGTSDRLFLLFYNRTFFTLPESVDDYHPDGDTTEWLLLPGPHTVHIFYGRQQLFMLGGAFFFLRRPPLRGEIVFAAQAGHRYHVDTNLFEPAGERRYCGWIKDDATGELVGGARECAPPGLTAPEPTPEPAPTPTVAAGELPK